MKNNWWIKETIYQIYPKSFMDSNNDGIGDIQGIISKLDYLENLGIDGIWMSPIFKSPQADNGYDISDYEGIDPLFGNIDDFDELISKGKEKNIKIILDLVLSHTSDEHPWFIEALKGENNKYHDYYIWRNGEKGKLPNDKLSSFGGSAWEYVEDLNKYYFHEFHTKQPSLNWKNPNMRKDLYAMINRWIEKGVEGFRLDVIDTLAKDVDKGNMVVYPDIYEYIDELSRETFQKYNAMSVGEVWSANYDNASIWANLDSSKLSMIFTLQHMTLDQGIDKFDLKDFDILKFKEIFSKWQINLYGKAYQANVLENHDVPRIVSRWGNDKQYHRESATMFANIQLSLMGTPFIYQGQEIGMTNVYWDDISKYDDIETINYYNEEISKGLDKDEIMQKIMTKSRDNARTPMQWDESKYAGFSNVKPWIDINDNYLSINVLSQLNDKNSILNYYKNMIKLRKKYEVFINGKFESILDEYEEIFAFKRKNDNEEIIIVNNFSEENIEIKEIHDFEEYEIISHNYNHLEDYLRPYEAIIFYRNL